MSHFGFYMAGVGVVGIGREGLLLAWDPNDRGPDAADDLDLSNIALYSWVGPLTCGFTRLVQNEVEISNSHRF